MPQINFVVRAALSGDIGSRWVWIQTPSDETLHSSLIPRHIVKIRGPSSRRPVYVELRKIDQNFRKKYNTSNDRFQINDHQDALVAAEWYRDAFGISSTTRANYQAGTVPLVVEQCQCPIWESIRAACHHPDMNVRRGTRLGLCGVWLGLFGAYLG